MYSTAGKLTVILNPHSFQELSFEARIRFLRIRVSCFETLEEFFEDLKWRFRGNKTIVMDKT